MVANARNIVVVSAVSAWEIAIKARLGRLIVPPDLLSDFSAHVESEGFELLPIFAEHGIRAGLLPGAHKDPFDRMLIAQAHAENAPIVSNEKIFDRYAVRRIW